MLLMLCNHPLWHRVNEAADCLPPFGPTSVACFIMPPEPGTCVRLKLHMQLYFSAVVAVEEC
jgi:hypothetical protein